MSEAALHIDAARTGRLALRPLLIALAALTIIAIGVERIILSAQPLWLDETWTGAIVTAPGWNGFLRELWLDVNAPLYYGLMRLWTGVFGASDLALKLPGMIFAASAAAIPFAWRRGPLSFEARLCWATLLVAWWGADNFLDARCYGLLFALSTLQCVAFARLMASPGGRAAFAWCALASLAILTQYYAVFVAAAQGLAFVAVYRKRALATWPAALAFIPAFGWIGWHAPRLAQFAGEGVAWHERLTADGALDMATFPIGPASSAFLILLLLSLAAAALLSRLSPGAPDEARGADDRALWCVAATGLAALAVVIASGVLRPTLVGRYLIPEAPPLLLGVVLVARRLPRAHAAYAALILLYAAVAIRPPAVVAKAARDDSAYGLERASQRLAAAGVSDLVFVWDHPAVGIMDAGSLRRLGGFFLARDGHPVPVTPLYVSPAREPNAQALAAANGPRRPGIIWIYDRTSRTAAARFPPRIAEADPRWTCTRFGDAAIGSLACWRR